MKPKQAFLALLLGAGVTQALACYTVFDRSGQVVYNGSDPPVDMSRPLHETLPARFPGGQMVFDPGSVCDSIAPLGAISVPRGGAPLLTDRRTAQAMHVPYTTMQGAIVMVEPRYARVAPGVSVVPATTFSLPAPSEPARGTVITELRNPPMTIVRSGDSVAVSEVNGR